MWNVQMYHNSPYRHHRARRISTVATADGGGGASAMPAKLSEIVMAFKTVPDPMARYKQLLFFATKLEALPKEFQQDDYKVPGRTLSSRPALFVVVFVFNSVAGSHSPPPPPPPRALSLQGACPRCGLSLGWKMVKFSSEQIATVS